MKNLLCVIACSLGLAFSGGSASAQDVTVFQNVDVLPMDEELILSNQTVIIRGDRIESMGPAGETVAPQDARVINGDGRFLMPGLAEMHGHLPSSGGSSAEDTLFLYAARGVTTVRGMLGNKGQFALRDKINAGDIVGPALYLAAPSINGNNTTNPDGARRKVRQYKDEGWDLLKVHEGLSVETYNAMAAEAADVGIDFAGHVPNAVGLDGAFANGPRTIDHLDNYLDFMGAEDNPVTQAMLDRAVAATLEAGAGVVGTMALWEHFAGLPEDVLEFDELKYVSRATRSNWAGRINNTRASSPAELAEGALVMANRRKLLKALSDGGVEILLGSDAPQFYSVPGFSIHREMSVMAEAGMSPYEILRSGTKAAGDYFADKDAFGTITPGARADFVLLDASPLEDIANADDIAGVMLQGRWLDKTAIDARLTEIEAKYN